MSKICPKCESNNVHLAATVPHALCVCFDCRHQWKNKYKPRKKTFFHKITASPEVLAPYFVFATEDTVLSRHDERDILYFSSITGGYYQYQDNAIAATVEKLKEVCDE
jgi:hypothetical protein